MKEAVMSSPETPNLRKRFEAWCKAQGLAVNRNSINRTCYDDIVVQHAWSNLVIAEAAKHLGNDAPAVNP